MKKRQPSKPGGNPKARSRAKAEDDAALWKAFSRAIDPLDAKSRVPDVEANAFEEMLKREERKTERIVIGNGAGGEMNGLASGKKTPERRRVPEKGVVPQPAVALGHFDPKQVRRIRSGRTEIDARIDLHGMRQNEAHGALRAFLYRSVAKGHRMVLVITGKGGSRTRLSSSDVPFGDFINEGAPEGGVLRRSVPLWLAEPDLKVLVVGFTTAHIRHGGEGALYVQLRRNRRG